MALRTARWRGFPSDACFEARIRKEPPMIRRKYAAWPILGGALLTPMLVDCGAVKDLQQAASGCDEINQGPEATAQLSVDANVKTFAQASAELKAVAGRIKVDVKAACVD